MQELELKQLLERIGVLEKELDCTRAQIKALTANSSFGQSSVNELLHGIVEGLHETIIFGLDYQGDYLFVWGDPALEKRYGLEADSMVAKNLGDVFSPEIAAERIRQVQKVFENGECHREVYEMPTPNGVFWHDISIAPLRNRRGETTAALCIILDITDRMVALREAHENFEQFKAVVKHTSDFILILQDDKVVFANEAVRKKLRLHRDQEVIGKDLGSLISMRGPDKNLSWAQSGEHEIVLMDETRMDVEFTTKNIRLKGRPAYLLVIHDATARKEQERRRKRWEERLQRTQHQESLTSLAAGLAHDFNNLLTAIHANAQMAIMQIDNPKSVIKYVQSTQFVAMRAKELVTQLRVYTSDEEIVKSDVDLSELVMEMTGLVRPSIPLTVEVDIDAEDSLPRIIGDPIGLRQVVVNLLLNAADAISDRQGNIRVQTRRVTVDNEILTSAYFNDPIPTGPAACLEVSDSGRGMDEEVMGRIFDPFYTTKKKGRGLGLASVRGIVRSHGGAILVDSKLGQGTRFTVILPIAPND